MATEKRLIDVDEAKRRIIAFATGCHSEVLTVDSVIMMLNQSDTVNAVEVVHGHTIPADQPKKVLLDRKCGKCDSLMLSTDAYGPNCGAKMDGDGNG